MKVRPDNTIHQKHFKYCEENKTTKAKVIRKAIVQCLGLQLRRAV